MDITPPEPNDVDVATVTTAATTPATRVDAIRDAMLAAARAVNEDFREREMRRLARLRDASLSSSVDRQ